MRAVIVIVSLVFLSCRHSTIEDSAFTTIDLSSGNGWTRMFSVYLDSTKAAKINIDNLNIGKSYYIGELKDSAFELINPIIKRALMKKYEHEIGHAVPDGGASYLILKSKSNNIESLVFYSGKESLIATIICVLSDKNNYNLVNSRDSTFIFKSLEKIKPPEALRESVQFIPPVIKEENVEK